MPISATYRKIFVDMVFVEKIIIIILNVFAV